MRVCFSAGPNGPMDSRKTGPRRKASVNLTPHYRSSGKSVATNLLEVVRPPLTCCRRFQKPARCGLSFATSSDLSWVRPPPGRWRWTSSCRSVAPPTAARSVTACSADSTSTWSSTTPRPRSWSAELSRGRGRFRRRASLSEAELTSLIDACSFISPGTPLRGRTMATLIGLLASTGLRSGEVVRLDRGDVDLTNGGILVRKTKFRKDRLIPVHPTTQAAKLRRYARERDTVFPRPKGEAFFLSSRGCRLSATGLQSNFAKARKLAGLDNGKPLRPHDLRHRFAVTRLRLWHHERADVQALLPLLATYLGHANYSDTAYYLTGSSDPHQTGPHRGDASSHQRRGGGYHRSP
ncbi:tyrosine-type recombinase/integrase [Bradyrhizobium elkanii]|uniref:tyrosine-type recombinase/integrase n=2 Tax=Bradyrhizobium elkanii TaxID=29448 RepID=UPI002FF14840